MKWLTRGQSGCLALISIFIAICMLFNYYERHKLAGLYHYLIGTKNIKEPLVREEFPFDKVGYERIYKIKPKYRGYYNVFIQLEGFDINWEKLRNECLGEVEITYIQKENIVIKNVITKFVGYQFSRNYDRWYSSVYLDQFIYFNNIFRKDIDSIKIRVNKPITCFPKGKDKKTYLVIRYTYNL